MSAYIIGQVKVKDRALWEQYVAGVALSLQAFEAKVLVRGQFQQALAGKADISDSVVIEFSNSEQLNRWFHSNDYQQLITLRDQAASVSINSYVTERLIK
jgi:uncharacterized protein (DUF1330 family)